MDDDLLHDFLIEAGELIDSIDGQLVRLESDPDDQATLNDIFRTFHTIKGGAGFLNLRPLVAICHHAEDALNLIRAGQRRLDPAGADLILESVDEVKRMFAEVGAGEAPRPAPETLLRALEALTKAAASPGSPAPRSGPASASAASGPASASSAPGPASASSAPGPASASSAPGPASASGAPSVAVGSAGAAAGADPDEDDPVLACFEAMLGAVRDPTAEDGAMRAVGGGCAAGASSPAAADEGATRQPATEDGAGPIGEPGAEAISEDEFDALLDAVQGRAPETPASEMPTEMPAAAIPAPTMRATDPPAIGTAAPETPAPETRAADERATLHSAPPAQPEPVPVRSQARMGEHSLRVDAGRVDGVMNLVGELVLVRNRLSALRARVRDDDLNRTLSRLNLVTSDLQGSVMRLRMQPLSKAFGRFPRVVRDLARQLGKEIVLETHGENTELDKGMVESLADPLVHLVRNAVDHGIEAPAERERAGKSPVGRVSLSARQEGSHIFVTVADDGGGLDPAVIKQKALDKGVIDARTALQMTDTDALQLVFTAGFSTRSAVSDISGRGVGLDVVKSQISRVNGTVDIQSDKGRGTRIVIRLPLTLAILPALMVRVAAQLLALPLPIVEEIVDLKSEDCSTMDGNEVLSLRGEVLPLLDLERWVGPRAAAPSPQNAPPEHAPAPAAARHAPAAASPQHAPDAAEPPPMFAVVVNTGVRRVGLVVHKLIGQEEVVIKSLGARLKSLPGFAGATITGDGGIALIIDVGTLFASWDRLAVHGTSRSAA